MQKVNLIIATYRKSEDLCVPLCPFISLSGKGTKGQNRMAWDPVNCWPLQLGNSAIAHSLLVLHADTFLMGYQEARV